MTNPHEVIRKILDAATSDNGRLEDAIEVLNGYVGEQVMSPIKNVSDLHNYCAFLDSLGASKIQFIPTTKERHEIDFGWLISGHNTPISYPFITEGEDGRIVGRLFADGFNFIFFDPSKPNNKITNF